MEPDFFNDIGFLYGFFQSEVLFLESYAFGERMREAERERGLNRRRAREQLSYVLFLSTQLEFKIVESCL